MNCSSCLAGHPLPFKAFTRPRTDPRGRRPRCHHTIVCVLPEASDVFEPRLDPRIAVAAVVAATPPILFWIRVARAEQRRKMEAEEKEKQREVSPSHPMHRDPFLF